MRIIAGQWRGRQLVAPPGDATRPTADRIREALFSMLASRVGSFEGLRVADLFAGTDLLVDPVSSRTAADGSADAAAAAAPDAAPRRPSWSSCTRGGTPIGPRTLAALACTGLLTRLADQWPGMGVMPGGRPRKAASRWPTCARGSPATCAASRCLPSGPRA